MTPCLGCGERVTRAGVRGVVTHPRAPRPIVYRLCRQCSATVYGPDHGARRAVAEAVELRLGLSIGEAS